MGAAEGEEGYRTINARWDWQIMVGVRLCILGNQLLYVPFVV